MAVQTITYQNKVALNTNQDIADVNKCNASDLNEIKDVVNNNAAITLQNQTQIGDFEDGEVYSTSEVITNKTWINNKPIYRKVFTGTLTKNVTLTIAHNISNLGVITSISGTLDDGVEILLMPYFNTAMTVASNIYIDTTNIYVTSKAQSGDVTVVVEYTKTSD